MIISAVYRDGVIVIDAFWCNGYRIETNYLFEWPTEGQGEC